MKFGTTQDLNLTPLGAALVACRKGLIGVFAFSALMNILLLTGPFYMLQIYDRVLTSHSMPTLMALTILVVGLLAILGLFDFFRSRIMARLAALLDLKISNATFKASVFSRLNGQATGDPSLDLRTLRQFMGGPAATGIFDIPWFPFYIGVIFLLHPWLGFLSVFGAILLVALAARNAYLSRAPERAAAQAGLLEDRFTSVSRQNAETVAAMGMLGDLSRRWQVLHCDSIKAGMVSANSNGRYASWSRTVRMILQSAILGMGAYLVIGNELSAGSLIAASIIFARALAPVDMAIAQWRGIVAAQQSFRRLEALVVDDSHEHDIVSLDQPSKSFTVSALSVATPDMKSLLAQDVSFELTPGDGLGIIGASGSGKSSLLRGLVGVWPNVQGEIRIDGATPDQWSDADRGAFTGYLPQDVHLFDGTIAENISRFRPDAQSEQVLAAARLAGVHDLVLSMPEGYETLIGGQGVTLSAGERQRVGLARALYGAPFLIVLDEPNAHIDAEGEQALVCAIDRLRDMGSIVIVVAHRQAAIANIPKLLFMHDGRPQCVGEKDKVLEHIAGISRRKNGALRVVKS